MDESQEILPQDEPADDAAATAVGEMAVDAPEAPDPPAPAAPALELDTRLGELSLRFEEMNRVLGERSQYDATKEEAFRQLYEDLDRFRALASAAQHKPVLIDIILLLDRVEQGLEAQPQDNFIASIRDELSEILARRGVSAMSTPEARFDPQRQRAVGTRPTGDESAHNTIAEIARAGYECDGEVLRATEVVVYRHTLPTQQVS
jgi:molecular chaperone GrpE